jgi:hypothetical protein
MSCKIKQVLVLGTAVALLGLLAPAVWAKPEAVDINGVWDDKDNRDHETYIRQEGLEVWWVAMSPDGGKTYTNAFHGKIKIDDQNKGKDSHIILSGTWADVPRGGVSNHGTLSMSLRVNKEGQIREIHLLSQTGGYGAKNWVRK